ncbi:MAG: hypothetical protein ACKVVP_04455 [Chloroflexota bacterium]
MDPSSFVPRDWVLIQHSIGRLTLAAGLILSAVLTVTLTRSVLPSLVVTRPAVRPLLRLRWISEVLALAVGVAAVLNVYLALNIAYAVAVRLFPRIWI